MTGDDYTPTVEAAATAAREDPEPAGPEPMEYLDPPALTGKPVPPLPRQRTTGILLNAQRHPCARFLLEQRLAEAGAANPSTMARALSVYDGGRAHR